MSTTQIILLALGAVLLFWIVGAYNRMVRVWSIDSGRPLLPPIRCGGNPVGISLRLRFSDDGRRILFTRTKFQTQKLAKDLTKNGIPAAELEKFVDTPYKHLSSGMRVRLAFAAPPRP